MTFRTAMPDVATADRVMPYETMKETWYLAPGETLRGKTEVH